MKRNEFLSLLLALAIGIFAGATTMFVPIFAEEEAGGGNEAYFKDSLQQAFASSYLKGLEYAQEGRFQEAKAQFKKSLEFNELGKDSKDALGILDELDKGTLNAVNVRAFFLSLLLKNKLERIEIRVKEAVDKTSNIKQQFDNISKETDEIRTDLEGKISNLQSKLDDLEYELRYIKNNIVIR